MQTLLRYYGFSLAFSLTCLALAVWYGWASTGNIGATLSILWIVFVLSILEISLSFDNAVVNATVLRTMDPVWQQRFLTIGILIAVFGMRIVFPIAIVAIAAGLGPIAFRSTIRQNTSVSFLAPISASLVSAGRSWRW